MEKSDKKTSHTDDSKGKHLIEEDCHITVHEISEVTRIPKNTVVQNTILEYFKQFDKQQYHIGMFKLVSHLDKCLNICRDMIENE